jgi:hypothetical protein
VIRVLITTLRKRENKEGEKRAEITTTSVNDMERQPGSGKRGGESRQRGSRSTADDLGFTD